MYKIYFKYMNIEALIQALLLLPRLGYDLWTRIISAVGNEFGEERALQILFAAGFRDEKPNETERKLRNRLRTVGMGTVIRILREHGIDTSALHDRTATDRTFTPAPKPAPAPLPPSQLEPPIHGADGRRLYRFSVSTSARDKELLCSKKDFQSSFIHGAATFSNLCNAIYRGYAVMPAILGGDGQRCAANFTGAELVFVDIDDGMTMEAAATLPLTGKSLLMYSTPSHKPDAHRFRIVFALAGLEREPLQYSAMVRSLIEYYGADEACKDLARLFYGSTDPTFYIPRYGGFVRYSKNHFTTKTEELCHE